MEVCAYLVADPETLELVEPGEGPLDDPAGLAQSGAVRGAFPGELRCDAAGPEKPTVLVVVVAAVGERPAWSVTWPTSNPADAGHRVQQGHQLSDIVTIPAGQRDDQRSAMPVDYHVVLAAGPSPVDRRRPGVSPLRAPGRASRRSQHRPCPADWRPATPPAAPHAVAARRRLRSSPADAARPSLRCSRPVPPERPASSRSCTARRRCHAAQPGHLRATARDTGAAWADEQATTGPHVPTGHQGQDQRTPNRSCRHNIQLPRPTQQFILKRSVREQGSAVIVMRKTREASRSGVLQQSGPVLEPEHLLGVVVNWPSVWPDR